jgi:hypothetical protein
LTEALIVNGVVIANGVEDSDGDILTKKDIKTIFMKYQRDTDTMHTNIKNFGVEVFASWISEVDTIIDGKVAPEGSWLATLKVTNEKLIQCINEGKLKGFSLGSVSEKAFTPKYWFINKSLNYRDIKDIEEVIPLFISFVDKPANQYNFEVMTYDAYINKNEKKDVEEMTEANKDEMISISALERVKNLFGIEKSEVTVEKADEEVADATEPTADETVTALFEKLDKIIAQNEIIIEGMNKSEDEEEVDEEEEIEKAEDEEEKCEKAEEDASSEEEKEDEEIEKEESSEGTESESEEEKEDEDEDDVHVDKRETHMIENQTNTETGGDFYSKTGRDSFGRKIKN